MKAAGSLPLTATLRNEGVITIRALRRADRAGMATAVHGLSERSVSTRLVSFRKELTEAGLDRIMRIEPGQEEMLVATTGSGSDERVIGSARHVDAGNAPGRGAEVCFVVEEDFHGLGIAGRLSAPRATRVQPRHRLPRRRRPAAGQGDARGVCAQRTAFAAHDRTRLRAPDPGSRR